MGLWMLSICATEEEIVGSRMKWIWIILALLYFFSPYDLIPGVHPAGWIDDIIIMILLFRYLAKLKRTDTSQPPPNGAFQGQQQNRSYSSTNSGETSKTPRTPYEILDGSTTCPTKCPYLVPVLDSTSELLKLSPPILGQLNS